MTGRSRACHDSELPKANANGIEIEHEIFGEPTGRPLLLVMGLGAQMIVWPDEFCEELAANGHRVIRFDNRDIGLSTKFEDAGIPDVSELMGLLEALDIPAAHLAGASIAASRPSGAVSTPTNPSPGASCS